MSQFTIEFLEQLEKDAQALFERFSVDTISATSSPTPATADTSQTTAHQLNGIPVAPFSPDDLPEHLSHLNVRRNRMTHGAAAPASVTATELRMSHLEVQQSTSRASPPSRSALPPSVTLNLANAGIAMVSTATSTYAMSHSAVQTTERVSPSKTNSTTASQSPPLRRSSPNQNSQPPQQSYASGDRSQRNSPNKQSPSKTAKSQSKSPSKSPLMVDAGHSLRQDLLRDVMGSMTSSMSSVDIQTDNGNDFPSVSSAIGEPEQPAEKYVSRLDVIPPPPSVPFSHPDERVIYFVDYFRHKRHEVRTGASEGLFHEVFAAVESSPMKAVYSAKTYGLLLRGLSDLMDTYLHQDAYCTAMALDTCSLLAPMWKQCIPTEELVALLVPPLLRILQDSSDASKPSARFVSRSCVYVLFRVGTVGIHALYEFAAKNPLCDVVLELLANHPTTIERIVVPRLIHDLTHETHLFETVISVFPYFFDHCAEFASDLVNYFDTTGQTMHSDQRIQIAHVLRICGADTAERALVQFATKHDSHRSRAAALFALSFPRVFVSGSVGAAKDISPLSPFVRARVGVDLAVTRRMQLPTGRSDAKRSHLLRYEAAEQVPDFVRLFALPQRDPLGLVPIDKELHTNSLGQAAFPPHLVYIEGRDLLHEIRHVIWDDPSWDRVSSLPLLAPSFVTMRAAAAASNLSTTAGHSGDVSSTGPLSFLSPSMDAVAALIAGLGDADALVRASAARGLGRIVPAAAEPALKYLLAAVDRDPDPSVREEVISVLPNITLASPHNALDVLAVLCRAVRSDAFYKARYAALMALSKVALVFAAPRFFFPSPPQQTLAAYGKETIRTLELLLRILRDGSLNREDCAAAIASFGAPGIDLLIGIVSAGAAKEQSAVRFAAVQALGDAIRICTRKTQTEGTSGVRLVWMVEQCEMLLVAVLERLLAATVDTVPGVRKSAFDALHKMQQTCELYLVPLVGGAEKASQQYAFVEMLTPQSLLPVYYSGMKDGDKQCRTVAAECLAKSPPQGELVLVEALLKDPNPVIRESSVAGMEKLGYRTSRALLLALCDAEDLVWRAVQRVLLHWCRTTASTEAWIRGVLDPGDRFTRPVIKTLTHVLEPGSTTTTAVPQTLRNTLAVVLQRLERESFQRMSPSSS